MRLLFVLIVTLFSLTSQAAEPLWLRLHGSNTLGAELTPKLVKRWLAGEGYKDIDDQLTASSERLIRARDSVKPTLMIEIHAHGSSTGFRSLEAGKADIAMSSRPIKSKELEKLQLLGKMDGPQSEFVVGLDGIAVVVHRDNVLQQVTKEQLRKIFSGEITNWSQLGAKSGPIHVYARDNNSGTYDTFKSLVLGKQRPMVGSARRYESNANLSDAVAEDRNGIGFVGLPYIRQARALAVADDIPLAITPERFTVATEDYVLARRLFFYMPQRATSLARSLVEFALSQSGQSVVAESGFVSQEIISGAFDTDVEHAEYTGLIHGAERLSLNFRFHRGSALLDNKARRDVQRLAGYLERNGGRNRELMLVGFSDSSESLPMKSLGLSIQRADGVADVLLREGLIPHKVRGYGPAVTVASNKTPQGREKNRRVEVWLK